MTLPGNIHGKIMRAVVEFDMIQDGDKILIGLSGGKDSLLLTYALAVFKNHLAKNFSLAALTINPGFDDENFSANLEKLSDFCRELEIPHTVRDVDIAGAIRSANKNPCFTCAYFRRAAVNGFANEIGANKVAYAHHLDDAAETFLMSLFSSGQLTTFLPKTFLDRTKITVIRPLIYLREYQVIKFVGEKNFGIIKSPCPFDGKTNRQTIKNLIADLGKTFPDFFSHITSAMRKNSVGDLWDEPKTRAEMKSIYYSYVHH